VLCSVIADEIFREFANRAVALCVKFLRYLETDTAHAPVTIATLNLPEDASWIGLFDEKMLMSVE
jgi:hypothetical protein